MSTQRTIKFRAWDNVTKGMYASDDQPGPVLYLNGSLSLEQSWVTGEFTLMQYTGLNDKDGREIYEGDILHLDNVREEIFGNVEMIDGSWRVYDKGRRRNWVVKAMEQWYTISVIGNIYEHKELIEA